MKPSWDDAPSWAKWLAMDEGGEWYWYEFEPKKFGFCFRQVKGETRQAMIDLDWEQSLERRP